MYPKDWPRCHCGDFVLDGHLTCGRLECDESRTRDERDLDETNRGIARESSANTGANK